MSICSGMGTRDRRALIGGSIVVGLMVAITRGAPAFRAWTDSHRTDAIAASEEQRTAERARVLLPALRDSLRQRRARLVALDSLLIVASSASVATADLASLLEDLAADAPMKISAMQMRADTTTRSGITRVAVRVNGVADVAGLAAFLRAVDGGDRYLAVRELAVSQPEPAASNSKPEMLRVELLVEGLGYIQPAAAR